MTGDEWFHEFERHLRSVSERKAQLAAVAGCRRVWHLMTDHRHQAAVEAAERLADGKLTEEEFQAVLGPVVAMWAGELPPATTVEWNPGHYMTGATRHLGSRRSAADALSFVARSAARATGPGGSPGWLAAQDTEGTALLALIADIVGPPSQPLAADTDWLTPTVIALAAGIYAERAFDSLPILADSLEEAGCHHPDILSHCRSEGPHVRGCWVVDLLRPTAPASLIPPCTPSRGMQVDSMFGGELLVDTIYAAFPAGVPPARPVTDHRCDECDEADRLLGGRTWVDVDADFPHSCHEAFGLLTPAAQAYYLPAYLCFEVRTPGYMAGVSVSGALERGELPPASFTAGQRAAVWAWAEAYYRTRPERFPPDSVAEAWWQPVG